MGVEKKPRQGLRGALNVLAPSLFPLPAPTRGRFEQPPVLDEYVDTLPSAQNAVDCIPGWNHALPPEAGVVAGDAWAFNDGRIGWCLAQVGPLEGKRVLELGPMEGLHTYLLSRQNPAEITAIEANRLCFLRCLITKEILDLHSSRFLLGDFQKWLQSNETRYDLIVASGVLYHMANPVRLLELMSARADTIYLWTHYFSDKAMPDGDPRRGAFLGQVETVPFQGMDVRLHRRSYHGAWESRSFCGGMYDVHSWMEREQILAVLSGLGFDDVRLEHEDPQHEGGPSLSILARRSGGTTTV